MRCHIEMTADEWMTLKQFILGRLWVECRSANMEIDQVDALARQLPSHEVPTRLTLSPTVVNGVMDTLAEIYFDESCSSEDREEIARVHSLLSTTVE